MHGALSQFRTRYVFAYALFAIKLRLKTNPAKGYFLLFVDLFLLDMVAVRILSTAVDTVKEQMPRILFLFLSE